MAVKKIPEGYHAVTPYLAVKGGAAAIAFYEKAFGAKELFRMPAPGGTIAHAEHRRDLVLGRKPVTLAVAAAGQPDVQRLLGAVDERGAALVRGASFAARC